MNRYLGRAPFKDVFAWAPIVLAVIALALVISVVTIFGTTPEPDEGAAAHIWQLLMVAQVPLMIIFAFRWLSKRPREAVVVIGLQVLAALGAMAPVAILGL